MHIKETLDVSFAGAVQSPPLEDMVVLVDGAGVARGVQRAFCARTRSVHEDGRRFIASIFRSSGATARFPESCVEPPGSTRAACSPPARAGGVRTSIAVKPAGYTWRKLAGAGALAGIGFTMSLFIAGQAFPNATDFSAAKIAVFAASILSAIVGTTP